MLSSLAHQIGHGYWGPITSSIDWCEENYMYSYYIAEFWNSISSLAMVVLGIFGVLMHHRSIGWRFSSCYLLVIVVGIGSVLFHATLQYEHQMLDEVPMVWTVCWFLRVLLQENGYDQHIYTIGIVLYCALATLLTSQVAGSAQALLFQSSFTVVMFSCVWFIWKLYKEMEVGQVTRLFHVGAALLPVAFGVWLFDLNLCFLYAYIPNPQLHAWWHILMSASLHHFFAACGYVSMMRRGDRPEVYYFAKWVPYIGFGTQKKV